MKIQGTATVLEVQWSVPHHKISSKTKDKFLHFAPDHPDRDTVFDRSLLIGS